MARRGRVTPLALARASVADGWRPRYEKAVAAVLGAFWAEAARSLSAAGTLPDSGAWARRLTDAKRPLTRGMVADGWRLGRAELGGKSAVLACGKALPSVDEINELDAEVYQSTVGRRLAQRVDRWLERTSRIETATTRARIEDLYKIAVAERQTPTQIAQGLLDAEIAENHVRASLLARTNTIWAYNAGAEGGYEAAGIERKEWLTATDELLCPFCAALDGTPVGIGELYGREGQVLTAVAGERSVTMTLGIDVQNPPLHPNCRCAIIPVL